MSAGTCSWKVLVTFQLQSSQVPLLAALEKQPVGLKIKNVKPVGGLASDGLLKPPLTLPEPQRFRHTLNCPDKPQRVLSSASRRVDALISF